MRIVSLIPSATEIVAALGCADQLVGRSHECDFPASVKTLPICTAPKLDLSGSSTDIDKRVQKSLKTAVAVYEVDKELLEELAPDVIITQSQCEICAVSLKDVEAAVCDWVGKDVQIVSLEPISLNDVFDDIHRVAKALNKDTEADALVADLKARISAIHEKTKKISSHPRIACIACIEWTEPMMAAGNWVPEMVPIAGGQDPLGRAGEHSPWMGWDELLEANPDVVAFMPCGYDLTRTASEAKSVVESPQWQDLPAAQQGRAYITNGSDFFNRPGPRLIESLEILAETPHPETFKFGHEGAGWRTLPSS
jgi:iron complex transport system substrate-binding protein